MGTFAKASIENLIGKYASVETVLRNFDGYDVWVLDNGVTIKLPADFSRVSSNEVMLICEVKLGLSMWEIDYIMENFREPSVKLN